jgi:hypothetical protein
VVNPIGSNQSLWQAATKAQPGVESPSDMLDALLGQLQQADSSGDPFSDGSTSSSPTLDLSGFGGDLQAVDPSVASAIAGVQTSADASGTAAVPSDLAQAALAAYMNAAQPDSQPDETDSPGIDLFG